MITILFLLLVLAAIALVFLILTGVLAIAWPVILIVAILLIIDILFFKRIFKRR